jgi:RecA-family ATPase
MSSLRKPQDMPWDLWEQNGHGPVSQVSSALNAGVTPVTPLRFSEMAPPGPREYVVEGIMPKGHTTSLFGDGGSAKSILALSAGTAISGGAEKWLGRKVHNSPVLYADFELDADEQRRRAYQVARGVYLEKPPYDLLYISGLGRHVGEVLKECLEICASEDVGVLIVDSLGIVLQGDAESARDVITFHHRYLDPFRVAGVTLLVVDHQGKTQAGERYQNKRSFGSVYKENLARSVIQV